MRGALRRAGLMAGLAVLAASVAMPAEAVAVAGSGSAAPAAGVRVRLVRVATLDQPLAMATRANSTDKALYVAEKTGFVMAIRNGKVDPTAVLDISGLISQGGEQGLLGLAFSPDNRYLYVDYTDVNGDTVVAEYRMRSGRADVTTRRQVLFVDQPFDNHNGGNLVTGPDGYLYIGFGDGGGGGDPLQNGQSLGTLLGKILRISPRPTPTAPYGIPADNPFVGTQGAKPEIWAYGLRNPWKFSFDRSTGDLWTADVGQDSWEEVDFQPAGDPGGENYGWNLTEGKHSYNGGTPPPNWTQPIYEYSHANGNCSITGGSVYRGAAIPDLVGEYVFADFCVGRLMAFRYSGGVITDLHGLGALAASPSSFGEDTAGEMYVLSLGGNVYKLAPRT